MNTSTINRILFTLIVVAIGWNAYIMRDNYKLLFNPANKQVNVCEKPIVYSIGIVDKQFGISQEQFKEVIATATQIWDNALNKKLFAYSETGGLVINLIFDDRQSTTIKLSKLGTDIDKDKADYLGLKATYDKALTSYSLQNVNLQNRVKAYDAKKITIDQNGTESQKKSLETEYAAISQIRTQLATQLTLINDMGTRLNQLAAKMNTDVNNYNNTGSEQGQEFEQGIYSSDAMGEKIDIFQFESHDKLERVVAHELGHALGLDHIDNPRAIMYALNQSTSLSLTADDINALKAICKTE